LAFSPDVQTNPIQCRNGTQREVYLIIGVNKFLISPGCKCILNENIFTSNVNVLLDYEWIWDCISLIDFELTTLISHLTMMEVAGLIQLTLQDLQILKLEASRSLGWLAHHI
jgi:hypothetical protein